MDVILGFSSFESARIVLDMVMSRWERLVVEGRAPKNGYIILRTFYLQL
jgi:hypothetical protein